MRLDRYAAAFLLFVVASAGCQRGSGAAEAEQAGEEADATANAAVEEDNAWAAVLAGKSEDGDLAMEARQYLAPDQEKNGLWKTSREQTLGWVDEFYAAGAAKVYAIYSPADELIRFNMCSSLLVGLPAPSVQGAAVLRRYNEIDAKLWGPDHTETKDEGQKYLYLKMDP